MFSTPAVAHNLNQFRAVKTKNLEQDSEEDKSDEKIQVKP